MYIISKFVHQLQRKTKMTIPRELCISSQIEEFCIFLDLNKYFFWDNIIWALKEIKLGG